MVSGLLCRYMHRVTRTLCGSMHTALYTPACLSADVEFFEERSVLLNFGVLEVFEQAFSFAYHVHQSALGAHVLFVLLQVFGKVVDALCE